MRILALVPGGISDQILFFPTIDALNKRYPDAQIDVVVEPGAKEAYRVSKSVHEALTFDFKARNSLADWGNLLGMLRDREYEVVFSLNNSWSVCFLLWLSGIPTRIGYEGGAGSYFFTRSLPMKTDQYVASRYHDLLQGLDLSGTCPDLAVNVPSKDLAWADAERKRLGVSSGGYVAIYGDVAIPESFYPAENWKLILKDFQKKQPELPLVLLQSDAESTWARSITDTLPNLKVTTPENLGQTVSLLAGASLAICVDSPVLHLAIASQTFTLGLFGKADPKLWLPQSDRILGIKSPTGQVADIAPSTVLEKVWGG